jgi:hypothetical protein
VPKLRDGRHSFNGPFLQRFRILCNKGTNEGVSLVRAGLIDDLCWIETSRPHPSHVLFLCLITRVATCAGKMASPNPFLLTPRCQLAFNSTARDAYSIIHRIPQTHSLSPFSHGRPPTLTLTLRRLHLNHFSIGHQVAGQGESKFLLRSISMSATTFYWQQTVAFLAWWALLKVVTGHHLYVTLSQSTTKH